LLALRPRSLPCFFYSRPGQKTWKLNANAAEDAYRQTLPLLVMNGRLGFDEVQSFLDSAYENKEITERADGKQLVDYSILDEVIKEKRGR